jgi:hypothetical protein
MSVNLTVKLVLDEDGAIDEAASQIAFTSALSAYKAERELEASTIETAVHAIFDQYRGVSVNMPYLVNSVLRSLNVQPANFKAMESKVLAFVRSNSDRLANKSKGIEAEAPRTRTFGIKKGSGGGVVRWSDIPEEEDEK